MKHRSHHLELEKVIAQELAYREIRPIHLACVMKDLESSLSLQKHKTDFLKFVNYYNVPEFSSTQGLCAVKDFFTGGFDPALMHFCAQHELPPLPEVYLNVSEMREGNSGIHADIFYSLSSSLFDLHVHENRLVQIITSGEFTVTRLREQIFQNGKTVQVLVVNPVEAQLLNQEKSYSVITLSVNKKGPAISITPFVSHHMQKGNKNHQILTSRV